MTDLLLVLIAALLGTLLLLGIAALLAFRTFAMRVLNLLCAIRAHAEADSNESLPAIRGALDDVVNVLIPPGGAR